MVKYKNQYKLERAEGLAMYLQPSVEIDKKKLQN